MFAQGATRGGKQLEWISLSGSNNSDLIANVLTTAIIVGSNTRRFVTLLPENIATGSVITMTRIVGNVNIATQVTSGLGGSDASLAFDGMTLSLQLMPVVSGVTQAVDLLSPFNTSDIESSRIMWWRSYYPWHGSGTNTTTVLGEALKQVHSYSDGLIDVRVKRKFDRSRWALVLAATLLTTEEVRWGLMFNLRGLIASTSGL